MNSQDKIRKTHGLELNPACYPVLAAVAEGPIHGYDVCRKLASEIGPLWSLGKSHVYALLLQLEKAGLVKHRRVGQESYPPKNVFSITRKGVDVLERWASQPVYHIRDMRLEFPAKLWIAGRTSMDRQMELINRQMELCEDKRARLESQKQQVSNSVSGLSLDFRLAVVNAAIGWLASLKNVI